MTDVQSTTTSRGQFLRNAAKGGIVLAGAGGVLASVQGAAFVSGPTSSDITTLQAAFQLLRRCAGGHRVLPSLPKTDTIPHTVKKLGPFLG